MASPNPQMMVDMAALQDLLNALHEAGGGNWKSLDMMVQYQHEASNPITKLRNQYNASVELYHAPEEIFHQTA